MISMTAERDRARDTFLAREGRALLCIGLTIAAQAIITINVLYAASLQSAVGTNTTLRPSMPRPSAEPAAAPVTPGPTEAGSVQYYQHHETW
jgi:hypothetical protein